MSIQLWLGALMCLIMMVGLKLITTLGMKKDKEIELYNQWSGIIIDITPEEKILFSIAEDISPVQLCSIIRAFKV